MMRILIAIVGLSVLAACGAVVTDEGSANEQTESTQQASHAWTRQAQTLGAAGDAGE